jgi:hypothetical protein
MSGADPTRTHRTEAGHFAAMAQRIDHNAQDVFGGACVIVPPGEGKPIELLMLDAQGDAGQFWATILTRIQMAMDDKNRQTQQARVFGVR